MPPRIFLGIVDIAGYYHLLERGFRELGVDCTFLNAYPTHFRTETVGRTRFVRFVERVGRKHADAKRSKPLWRAALVAVMSVYFLATLPKFDVYVFGGGESFFGRRELPLLRWLRKKVIMVFHGSDARPPYLNAAFAGTSGAIDARQLIGLARRIKNVVAEAERNAEVGISHPLTGHFHERPFLKWLDIGIPAALPVAVQPSTTKDPSRCVIVHAPSRPEAKGSPRIERAVEALRARGLAIELVKIVNRPNHEVLQAIAAADFVVDELFSDTTMATFATEAAMLGKPAVVGMYGLDSLRRSHPAESIPPAFVCHPDDVERAIETLARDRELRLKLGDEARRFVAERWDARRVAERFLRVIAGDIPAEWWFDPRRIDYVHGWGLTEQRLAEVLRACVEAGGVEALEVHDKPELERALAELARRPNA